MAYHTASETVFITFYLKRLTPKLKLRWDMRFDSILSVYSAFIGFNFQKQIEAKLFSYRFHSFLT